MSARCEDYPCCGHADGGCPNEDGSFNCYRCGRRLSRNAHSPMCDKCQRRLERLMREDDTGQSWDNESW